jgi:hypothetical protein
MAETIGSLIDKISIIELKRFHMAKQLERIDATQEHKDKCAARLTVMNEQRDDLATELTELADAVMSGRKKMKVYRQFKMYNDPAYRVKSSAM